MATMRTFGYIPLVKRIQYVYLIKNVFDNNIKGNKSNMNTYTATDVCSIGNKAMSSVLKCLPPFQE